MKRLLLLFFCLQKFLFCLWSLTEGRATKRQLKIQEDRKLFFCFKLFTFWIRKTKLTSNLILVLVLRINYLNVLTFRVIKIWKNIWKILGIFIKHRHLFFFQGLTGHIFETQRVRLSSFRLIWRFFERYAVKPVYNGHPWDS